jgi:diguanylate cyclase (GGDEF)-like protein
MIRFARGNVKPDTPLLYLLPIFGILLLFLIWSALSDFLVTEHARVVRNAVGEAASHVRAYERSARQQLRAIDQVARLVQYEFERSRERNEPFDLAAVAKRALAPADAFSFISVTDKTGNATAVFIPRTNATVPWVNGAPAVAGEAFNVHRNADARGLHVGDAVAAPALRTPLIPVTRRVNNPDGSFAGVVAVWVDPARFTDAYDVAEHGRRGLLAVLGPDGVFRAYRSGDTTAVGHSVDYAATLALVQRSESASVAVTGLTDHIPRFAAVRALAPYNVVAIVGAAEDEALAEHRAQREYYLNYAIAASLVIVGVLTVAMLLVIRMKQSHREAEAARATYRAASEGSLDAFFLLRTVRGRDDQVSEFRVEDANGRALQLLGMPRERVVGVRLRTLLPKLVRRRLYRRYFKVLETGQPLEEEIETDWGQDGSRWFRHQVVPIEYGLAVTLRNIDDAKQVQYALERAANLDSLTSLPNRRQFIEHAVKAIDRCKARGTNLGVLFIDLDNFKNVNDTLGHDIGDLLLQAVAVRLQSCIRADDILWRLGGDEFIVTMEDVRNRAEAEVVCRRIADVLGPPITIREISISTSASIGVAFCPEDAGDANTLLRNADLAMYEAKEFGSGVYQFFTPAMGVRRAARIDIEQDLRTALRRYELFLVYQPQVRLSDGKVTGLEALVRWQHPDNGVMHPLEFIPIAEEGNLIHLLGDYVFQIACSQIRRWQAMGQDPIPIAVNLSPRQFAWAGIAERLLSIVEASGVSPGLIQIELTESAIMKDTDGARRKLSELKRHGISLSVDDFGTGHSSLASLQSFPIDTLKIDRSFVERSASQDGVAILRAIVLMAHTLRINVVAEGVETKAQLELLRKIGCDQAQGFLIAHPVLADDVPAMLQRLAERTVPQKSRAYAHS